MIMNEIRWDKRKAVSNLRKHAIDFADAATVLDDEYALTVPDVHEEEERFISLGMDALGRIPVVVYAQRGETMRLISARRATSQERRQYQEDR